MTPDTACRSKWPCRHRSISVSRSVRRRMQIDWASARGTARECRAGPGRLGAKDVKETRAPKTDIVRLDAGKKRCVPFLPLLKRHAKRGLHSIRHIVNVVGVHNQRLLELCCGSGKLREDQNAWILLVLRRDIL